MECYLQRADVDLLYHTVDIQLLNRSHVQHPQSLSKKESFLPRRVVDLVHTDPITFLVKEEQFVTCSRCDT